MSDAMTTIGRVQVRSWPAEDPARLVVLVHGYGEHIGRYDETARKLADAGFSVRGTDLRDISTHPAFEDGGRPGTYGYCTARTAAEHIPSWCPVTAGTTRRPIRTARSAAQPACCCRRPAGR